MSFEEEESGPSLKELLTKNLEMNGTLGNIQAQLRASIFLTFEEEFKEKNIPLVNEKNKKLLESPVGKTAIAVIQDFLHCLNLEFSLAVFNPETNVSSNQKTDTKDMLSNLGLFENTTDKDEKAPILFKLIESLQQSKKINGLESHNATKKLPQLSNLSDIQPRIEMTKASLPSIQSLSAKQNNIVDNLSKESVAIPSINGIRNNDTHTQSLIQKQTESKEEEKYLDKDVEDDYGDEEFSSVTEPQEDTGNASESKNDDKPEDTDAEEISEDILEESLGSLLDINSEASNQTLDVSASETKQVPDYQENL